MLPPECSLRHCTDRQNTANAYSNVTNSIHQRDLQCTASSSVLTTRVQQTSRAMRPTAFTNMTRQLTNHQSTAMRHSPTLFPEYSKRVKQSRTATRLAFTNMTSITASTSILTARAQQTSTTTRLTALTNVTKCIHQCDLQSKASSSLLTPPVQRTSTAMQQTTLTHIDCNIQPT